MFVVIQSSITGAQQPALFRNKEDAIFYKRCSALSEAYSGTLGEEFVALLPAEQIEIVPEIFDKVGRFIPEREYTMCEIQLLEKFERFLVARKSCFTEYEDMIMDPVYECIHFQVFEAPCGEIETSAGIASTVVYDDGCAKGIHVLLDDNIVCSLDVYDAQEDNTEGEARVLVYKKEYGEDEEESPIDCITINK